jgi:putative transposase
MILTYKYKLYKTKRLRKIDEVINIAGIIYNHCIALHKRYYKLYGKYLNKYQLQKHLTKLKKLSKYSYWKKVPSQAIQDITDRIDKAYKLFFRNQKHKIKSAPPTFQKVKKYRSYTLKQAGYKIDNNVISLNGYKFKFWLSRPIDGKIKTITIKRDNIGDYYICISLEKEYSKVSATSGKIVGIDFGLKTFLVLSDGTQIEAPLYYLKHLKSLKQFQRKLSKKVKGSNHYEQAKRTLAKLYHKVANSRKDFFHKLANELGKKYHSIVIEDLNIKAMQKLWGIKISDLSFSEFVSILEYKTNLIKIYRYYPSSKTCSACGSIKENLKLSDRIYKCDKCGLVIDRDLNASINICRVGTSTLGIDDVRLAISKQSSF